MSSNIIFIFFNVCFAGFAFNYIYGQPATLTRYEMIPGTRGQYKFHKTPKPWDEAKRTCESEGAVLFYPDTKSEAIIVTAFWNKREHGFPDKFSVGLKKEYFTFETINRTLITKDETSLSWYSGEPNNDGGREHCVEILATYDYEEDTEWVYNDIPCEITQGFICKSLGYSSVTQQNYESIPGIDGWYRYHNLSNSWDDAKLTCESENASFFYADTRIEAVTVLKYFEPEGFYKLFTGLRKSGKSKFIAINGTFITVETTSIPWLSGSPKYDEDFIDNDCVMMVNDRGSWVLSDYPCEEEQPFVCKSPLSYTASVAVQFKVVPYENQLICDTTDKEPYEVTIKEGESLEIKVDSKYFIDYLICTDYYNSNIVFQGTPTHPSNFFKLLMVTATMAGKWNCTILTLKDIKGLGSPIINYRGFNFAAVYCTVQVNVLTDDVSTITKSPIENLYKESPTLVTTSMYPLHKPDTTSIFSLQKPEIKTKNSVQNPVVDKNLKADHRCKEDALKTEIEKLKTNIEVYEYYMENCCKTANLNTIKHKFEFFECDPSCFKMVTKDPLYTQFKIV